MRAAPKQERAAEVDLAADHPESVGGAPRGVARVAAIATSLRRERQRVLDAALQQRGLMPLLMKQRNGQRWTLNERIELRHLLRKLPAVALGLRLRAVPGKMLPLPFVAWWLERRRRRQKMRKTLRR